MRLIIGTIGVGLVLLGCVSGNEVSSQQAEVPIILQPDSDHGTCSIGYSVNAGGAVLRSGPSADHPVVATLAAGHVVRGCSEAGSWIGVIDGQDETCDVGVILTKARPYAGPCDSGWIDQQSLTSIFG